MWKGRKVKLLTQYTKKREREREGGEILNIVPMRSIWMCADSMTGDKLGQGLRGKGIPYSVCGWRGK